MLDILINQLDEHNEGNILATKEFKPKKVYYIIDKSDKEKMKKIYEYYKNNFTNIEIEEFIVSEGNSNELEKIINPIKNKDIVINLTGGKRINSLILLDICIKNNIKAMYIDIRKKLMYEFIDGIKLVDKTFEDLDIDDIVKAAGGEIVEDASGLCNKKDLIYFSEQISKHLSLWHKYKQNLYDGSIFEHDNENPQTIYINIENLSNEESTLIDKVLDKFIEMKEVECKRNDRRITVNFLNSYLKSFIFKSGTWLEIETNKLINNINEIDESKNGVMFLWNNEHKSVRNEVDVVAVKDSVPIFISCKDSDKYNEMALNELNVYASKIGGDNAYKILVATKEPIKSPVIVRAKEMGIHIIIFDGDEQKFVSTIKGIINKK